MNISLIAAIGKNRELGRGNELIFKIPEDMKFFREKTRGHTVIMGRKTYESIGRPLPNRTNIVISRNNEYKVSDTLIKATSIEEALGFAKKGEQGEIFIIGGAQIYQLAMPYADKLYLTLVDAEVPDADAFFPDYDDFKKIVLKRKSRDENYEYTFLELKR
jgi:dihydrofolate reductase